MINNSVKKKNSNSCNLNYIRSSISFFNEKLHFDLQFDKNEYWNE